jgi:hypothetical protein
MTRYYYQFLNLSVVLRLLYARLAVALRQEIPVERIVAVLEENLLPPVAALCDMTQQPGDHDAGEANAAVWAYCLMADQVHLVLVPATENRLSRARACPSGWPARAKVLGI